MKLFGVGPRRLGPPDPIRNAEVRILPPQPASPVSTGQPAKALKTTRYRGISRIRLGLRVRIWATEASIWPLVSEATFWCLVFAEPIMGRPPSSSHRWRQLPFRLATVLAKAAP